MYRGQVWHFSIPRCSYSSPKHIEMRRKRATPSPPSQCCAHPVPGVAETNATPRVASMKLHRALPLPPNPMLDAPRGPVQCCRVGLGWALPKFRVRNAISTLDWGAGDGIPSVFLRELFVLLHPHSARGADAYPNILGKTTLRGAVGNNKPQPPPPCLYFVPATS